MWDSVKSDTGNSFLHLRSPSLAGSATCLVYGDLHFVTFDEKNIDFTGTCTYILTQICENTTGRGLEPELGMGGGGGGQGLRL